MNMGFLFGSCFGLNLDFMDITAQQAICAIQELSRNPVGLPTHHLIEA
jgi:hypothetical protein